MKSYVKPFIDEEEIELEDIIAVSNEKDINTPDAKDPFEGITPKP